MRYICTWLCVDEKGSESHFPQTGLLSSSDSHQHIYWRCLLLFFITSRRFNTNEKHLLFTNCRHLPQVDGKSTEKMLKELGVEVVFKPLTYKTPKGYYNSFQNQFYEFSILEEIAAGGYSASDEFLVTDSDCIFLRSAQRLWLEAAPQGFLSFRDPVSPDYRINGLSRNDMKQLFEELLKTPIDEIPEYHLGEFLLASVGNIRRIVRDFSDLWPVLLERHRLGKNKFNEEAHTLSYLYFLNGWKPSDRKDLMKRIWTNPLFYRNVEASDTKLVLWHLPAEKTFGLHRLYWKLVHDTNYFGFELTNERFNELVNEALSIPRLPFQRRLDYYTRSYYRAARKRITRLFSSTAN